MASGTSDPFIRIQLSVVIPVTSAVAGTSMIMYQELGESFCRRVLSSISHSLPLSRRCQVQEMASCPVPPHPTDPNADEPLFDAVFCSVFFLPFSFWNAARKCVARFRTVCISAHGLSCKDWREDCCFHKIAAVAGYDDCRISLSEPRIQSILPRHFCENGFGFEVSDNM
ncbi:hypothetical protein CDAR_548691 [Caerostris darwini]|uniref:Uncharacterized protein n=1 Tax=Caerostris darwini TaxID=1538125 RepID=A0AAV4WHZ5_9ARAC|nr:hypothetical protein CDAR_548691 [Caerostris darwini]